MSPDATVCGQAELLLVSLTAALPMQLALHAGCCGVSLMLRTAPSESRALSVGGGTSTDSIDRRRLALVDRCVMPHTDLPLAGVVLHDSLLDANLEADRVVLDPLAAEKLVEGQAKDPLRLRFQVDDSVGTANEAGAIVAGGNGHSRRVPQRLELSTRIPHEEAVAEVLVP